MTLNLGTMTIQWDEVNHLNGGLLLLHGNTQKYMDSAMFYPPLDDLITTVYFGIGGVSVFSGRLVAVTFALLSLWVIFEFTNRVYGKKNALLSTIFLGTMPGFVWLSRVALVETMLIFFFSAVLALFFMWLRTPKRWLLVLSGVMLGLGILAKYQVAVTLIVMAVSILFLCKSRIKSQLSKVPFIIIVAIIVVTPWIIISYETYSTGMLDQWIYAASIGNPDKMVYSTRLAAPIFYLVEMVWPYGVVHPVSILMYSCGLLGIGLLIWRRHPEDKFLLIWFGAVYIFFTLIGNKQWRYVVPLFPVLALSASNLIICTYEKLQRYWRNNQIGRREKRLSKVGAGFLIGITAFAVAGSCFDAYVWVSKDYSYDLPVEDATLYVTRELKAHETMAVLCPLNIFSADIVKFYIYTEGPAVNYRVLQYPDYPVDTFTPDFNVSELIEVCEQNNVKYLMLFEYGETYPYFESTLTKQQVHIALIESQKFVDQTNYGKYPCRIFIVSFN